MGGEGMTKHCSVSADVGIVRIAAPTASVDVVQCKLGNRRSRYSGCVPSHGPAHPKRRQIGFKIAMLRL
jgi:hypothetical protein